MEGEGNNIITNRKYRGIPRVPGVYEWPRRVCEYLCTPIYGHVYRFSV